MKKTLLLNILIIATISTLLAQPTEFDFTPNNISAGFIALVQVNGNPASASDFIGAFDENTNCAGSIQLLDYGGQTFCSIQIYGDDTTTDDIDEGMNEGETFTLRLWVSATGEILENPVNMDDVSIGPVTGWDATLIGTPIPGWDFADGAVVNFLTIVDEDMDGYTGAADPDDTDPCNPDNNVAVCDTDGDGIPDGSDPFPNCDGTEDECGICNGPGIPAGTCDCAGTPPATWYADTDGDGLGDPNDSQESCTQPPGYVDNANDDCDGQEDECGVCNGPGIAAGACDCAGTPPTTWYQDADNDGLGNPDVSQESCDQPNGYVANSDDDNDGCDGEFDECGVCNGSGPSTWYADTDGDGLGDPNDSQESCDQPPGYVDNADDPCDGQEDECGVCNGTGIAAGTCDCAGTPPTTWYQDADLDGLGNPDVSQESCDQPDGYVANSDDDDDGCDGEFDECGVCDGPGPSTWYADIDGDGLGDPNDSQENCTPPVGYVDNANDPCDGTEDECGVCNGPGIAAGACDCAGTLPATWYADMDNDSLGDPNNSTESCEQPPGFVSNSNDDDDTTPADPTDIPTLSQWGLILLSLILLSISTISATQKKYSLVHSNGLAGSVATIPYFDKHLFKRILMKSIPLMLLIFVLISFIEGDWFMRNLIGTVLSIVVCVYILHFVELSKQFIEGNQ